MKYTTAILSLLFSSAAAVELTPDNWDAETGGKVVFLKMFAPWCGHCKKMKPDWDKLMEASKDSTTQLIADVDCTAGGKPICEDNGVQGFPTLKYGDPSDLQDYQGGRDFDSLEKFIKDELKPMCSPSNLDLCDDDKKAEIEKIQALSDEDLNSKIEEEQKKSEDAEAKFKEEVSKLQETYQKLMDEKEAAQAAVKAAGLGLLKSVKAARSKVAKGSDEL
mmetsp:Transcript_26863/g.30703  ORF Transcript_26863/g.30703 Transcript_26863/m.30703 type:complete len:220 (-) Transcript_26863:279-938(-)